MAFLYTNYQIPRFAKVTGATAGFPFNHASEAFNGGLRRPGRLVKKTVAPMDAPGRPIADKMQVEVDFDFQQTRIADFLNLYKLILSGPHQWLFQTANGVYWAFTDNDSGGGTFTTPVGSSLVGGNVEFMVSQNDRGLRYNGSTNMADTEWTYMVTNSGAAATGGSSGTTAGLYAHPYARTNYRRSGINSFTVNGQQFAPFNQASVSFKTKQAPDGMDHRGRPIPAFVECSAEISVLATDAASILAIGAAEQQDYTIAFGTWNDEILQFTTGAAGIYVTDQEIGDSSTHVRLAIHGEVPMTNDQTGIDIGVTTANTINCKLIGY